MLIIADRNIPQVQEAFAGIGEVRLHEGRGLGAADVKDADILLVRSVTPVNAALLEGSRLRFVGSATIGTDHVDMDYLKSRDIEFAYAPGTNALAVAEYVLAALLALHENKPQGPVGIVGFGNTGSALARLLNVLGIEYLACDPPLQESGLRSDMEFASLPEIRRCPIISLHVPLIRGGRHPTFHIVDESFLSDLAPGTLLINSSRGAVVDNPALLTRLQRGDLHAVLDVWEGEPAINAELLEQVRLGTSHIAGYSVEGRLNGTQRMYEAVCAFLGIRPGWRYTVQAPLKPVLMTPYRGYAALRSLVLQVYDICRDDMALRALLSLPPEQRSAGFDRLRRDYPPRREFAAYRCSLASGPDSILQKQLAGLGFALG
ncbi:MAG TPA: 4-phosphoerythronate dehydrogenase [Gammaproteobacteria bacterium]|nr:4-phosphoerythronate dehydrogenase [Gammaproteobacteria bacterium]